MQRNGALHLCVSVTRMKSEEPALHVVFVHGTSAGGTMRRPVTEVAGARRPVPDPPGHGSRRDVLFSTAGTDAVSASGVR